MVKMEFVVVIVLHNHKIILLRQHEQFQAPFRRHHDRGRELMMGRDVNGAYAVLLAQLFQRAHIQSVLIQPDTEDGGTA